MPKIQSSWIIGLCLIVAILSSYLTASVLGTSDAYFLVQPSSFIYDPKYSRFLGPLAILLSAFGAWIFAYFSIRTNSKMARQKSTFDYLSKISWDQDYIEAKKIFISAKVGPKKLTQVARDYEALKVRNGHELSDSEKETIKVHSAIKNILNEYEALAIAIRSGALDEKMVRENIKQQYLDHVRACSEFIDYTRQQIVNQGAAYKNPESIWRELQTLQKKWEK